MTDFVSNLINKFKKIPSQKDLTISIKPNSKNLVSEDSILLNEHLKVNIYSLKEVNVEKDGVITGNIHSKSCIVNGRVNGNILSSEYIEVKNTAVIEGNIKSGSIQIEAGSMINGFISIEKKIKLPIIVPQAAEPAARKVPNNIDELEKLHPSAKPTLPNNEVPQIKKDPIIQPSASEILTEVPKIREKTPDVITELPKIKAEVPEIQPVKPEIAPHTNKTIPKTVKDEITTENPPKKIDSSSSNDSWW